MLKDFFAMMFGLNMNDSDYLAAQIISIYRRYAKAWTDLRGQWLYEKTIVTGKRSEERREGKEGASMCRSRRSPKREIIMLFWLCKFSYVKRLL